MRDQGDIVDDILSWTDDTDESLLDYLAEKLADDRPVGFMDDRFSPEESGPSAADQWIQHNLKYIIDRYNPNIQSTEKDIALLIYFVLQNDFPNLPAGLLSVLVARHIIRDRSSDVVPPKPLDMDDVKNIFSISFDEAINRAEFARIMRLILAQNGLSIRDAAEKAGVSNHMPKGGQNRRVKHP